ncbi:MAG: hypothetical protein Kow0089_17370 [Desulfobulbaceae bacterium]
MNTAGNPISKGHTPGTPVAQQKQVSVMKRFHSQITVIILAALLAPAFLPGSARAVDVCSQGTSEPPFLAYGVNSNLLMLLDNSGSMLDMAYVDSNNECFDETFDTTASYAGAFDTTVDPVTGPMWYVWREPTPAWRHQAYTIGDLVTFEGVVYRATSNGVSVGDTIDDDTGVDWEPLLRPDWVNNHYYHMYSFVFTGNNQVYYATNDGISNGTNPSDDTGVIWAEVQKWQNGVVYPPRSFTRGDDLTLFFTKNGGTSSGTRPTDDTGVEWDKEDFHAWQPDINYNTDDIVTYRGMIYRKTAAGIHTSAGLTIYEDAAGGWSRIDEGYFEESTMAAARAECTAAAGTKHSGTDACVTVNNSGAGTPEFVSKFAASGNFLNWATTSKFDIQKDILTGGKYNAEEQRIISENRGCAGNRFIKQFRLDEGTPLNAADDMFLTMAVRKPGADDRVDWTDDTGRFEIYAITASGMNFDDCQDAIEQFQDPGGLGPAEASVAACVGFDGKPSGPVDHIVYHKVIQECWFYAKHGRWKGGNDHPFKTCPLVYQSQSPLDIQPADPAYVCYGIYDPGPHDSREGFVGRCWEPGSGVGGVTCDPKPRNAAECDWTVTDPCEWQPGGANTTLFRNLSGSTSTQYCTQLKNNGTDCQNNQKWATYFIDSDTGLQCDPNDPKYSAATPAYWSANLDGIPGDIAPEPDPDLVGEACVDQAMHDFCLQTEQPEVIDPSDQATTTTDFWNLPAILVDAGLAGQLGEHPLSTMKVHISALSQPQGILHDKATQLRIGAMAFNDNGAGSECGGAAIPPQIVQYCPATNKDGAYIISPIKLGSLVTDNNGTPADSTDDTRHVDDLVAAINNVQATSWTPLAEAMYDAIGYYTQNPQMRLQDRDFQTDADVLAGRQNNREYLPGSYVLDSGTLYQTMLGGTSNGAALVTDDAVKWDVVTEYRGPWADGTPYSAGDIVLGPADGNHSSKLYITYTGGMSQKKMGAPADSPLYDLNIVWEPLIDPVARFCQSNNILIITEGASTTDINPDVVNLVNGTSVVNAVPVTDVDGGVPDATCADGLTGSTYLDDLIYFGRNYLDPTSTVTPGPFTLYPTGNQTLPEGDFPYAERDKNTITTHIVVAGSLRSNGAAGECDPKTLMESAAYNGGGSETPLVGENPEKLKENLSKVFNDLSQRASAGSAASVISSARGGEGAIYQAIFWPRLTRLNPTDDPVQVAWAGDVHGLYLDNRGYMYEDTVADRILRPYEDLDGDGWVDEDEGIGEDIDRDSHFDNVDEDVDLDGNLDVYEDVDGDGVLDVFEDTNLNGVLDPGEDVDGDGKLDINEDLDGDGKLDTVWHDLDGDGIIDSNEGEDIDGDGYLDTGEDVNHNNVLDSGEDLDKDNVLDRTEDLNGDGLFDPFLDLDGDGHRDVEENLDYPGYTSDRSTPDGDDRRVIIYYDSSLGRSMACRDTSIYDTGICSSPVEMEEVNYLWSAADWLKKISDLNYPPFDVNDILLNRTTYISNEKRRYIFTWNDLDNDGIVDQASEILPLEATENWDALGVSGGRGIASRDFDLPNDISVDRLINWIRGRDDSTDEDLDGDGVLDAGEDANGNGVLDRPLRSRSIPLTNRSAQNITWRLGDIIHSTPMTVASPAEGYHLIYNDYSYAQFLTAYKRRRHVVYFGANDGMLHAVNAGFYSEKEKRFCLYPLDSNGYCTEPAVIPPALPPASYADAPELGAELWAFVPYNLLPHLKCLADPGYDHKYFVDQRPRIFDVQIFQEEAACRDINGDPQFDAAGCIHPNGWGTILVNGMRFGGAPINAVDLNGVGGDTRRFASSWFIMDITDPESKPTLLGELTFNNDGTTANIGYTTGMPTMAIMKHALGSSWYLVFGSGPVDGDVVDGDPAGLNNTDAIKGESDLPARAFVLPLDWLIPTSPTGLMPLRISPNHPSVTGNNSGTYVLTDPVTGKQSPNGFVSDMITVDYDINPSYEKYKSDVIYFGTVEGTWGSNPDGTTFWDGGGKLWRLINKEIDPTNNPFGRDWSTYGRGVTEKTTYPADWQTRVLIDLSSPGVDTNNAWHPGPYGNNRFPQPITAAPSVGTDGHNFWVYFGTGRFYDAWDKTDVKQQSYYGIKEPALIVQNTMTGVSTRYFKWYETAINPTGTGFTGNLGLTKVDDILVGESPSIRTAPLVCRSTGGWECLPPELQNASKSFLYDLDYYISGIGDGPSGLQKRDQGGTIIKNAGAPCWEYNGCTDGWYKDFYPYVDRERNVGQATLLGGLVTFTTYQPFNDVCQAEGTAYLYGVYFRTGTAWHKNIFGQNGVANNKIVEKVTLGRGLATTPNLHVGSGTDDDTTKAFVQTSTGEILEIEQENLPVENVRSGRSRWRQCN